MQETQEHQYQEKIYSVGKLKEEMRHCFFHSQAKKASIHHNQSSFPQISHCKNPSLKSNPSKGLNSTRSLDHTLAGRCLRPFTTPEKLKINQRNGLKHFTQLPHPNSNLPYQYHLPNHTLNAPYR